MASCTVFPRLSCQLIIIIVAGLYYALPAEGQTTDVITDQPPHNGQASVLCDSTSMTVLLDRSLLENNGVPSDVHFEDDDDANCLGYSHDSQRIALTTRYDRCLTVFEEHDITIVYSNMVTYFKPTSVNGSVISRDFRMQIPVYCSLNREQLLGTDSFKPKVGTVVFSEEGYGNFSLSLNRYSDDTFTREPADPTAEVLLGETLYYGVNLTSVPDLSVFIQSCWATPSPYSSDQNRYDLIDNGCSEDDTIAFYRNLGSSLEGFAVDAFTFIGDYLEVYLHCEILVCDANDQDSRCDQGCLVRAKRSGRHARAMRGSSSKPHTISNGPISLHHPDDVSAEEDTTTSQTANTMLMLIGMACVVAMALMVGIVAMSRRRESDGYRRLSVVEPGLE